MCTRLYDTDTVCTLQTGFNEITHHRAQPERLTKTTGMSLSPSADRASLPEHQVSQPPGGVIFHGNPGSRVMTWGAVWVEGWIHTGRQNLQLATIPGTSLCLDHKKHNLRLHKTLVLSTYLDGKNCPPRPLEQSRRVTTEGDLSNGKS